MFVTRVVYLVYYSCRESLPDNRKIVAVTFDIQHPDLISADPPGFNITEDNRNKQEWIIHVKGLNAGHSVLSTNVTPNDIAE